MSRTVIRLRGPWVVQRAVGTKPLIVGRALKVRVNPFSLSDKKGRILCSTGDIPLFSRNLWR